MAVDGKALRGTLDVADRQNVILAVAHDTREVVAQARAKQCGDKSSEIPEVRTLLMDIGLEKKKMSLDAHHFNPTTIAQIQGRWPLPGAGEGKPATMPNFALGVAAAGRDGRA